jgi:acyl-CoA synthetase (NDP forming)
MSKLSGEALAAFFRPRTVALVGASDKSAWSRMIHSRFAMWGHEGKLYAVNRSGSPAHGLEGFKRCADVPDKIDMAYIYVPAAAVTDALRDAAGAGVRQAVVLSSGFSEAGEEGVRLERELAQAAQALGVVMMGPNSLGFANVAHRSACTSIPTRLPLRENARLALVSQSGALVNEFGKFAYAQRIGVAFTCATGNEAQIGVADVLDYLVDDPKISAIATYLEGVSHPDRFAAAAERARLAKKPIVILKIGRSQVSSAVAQAHTGSLVGDDGVFDAMCRRYGVARVESIEELILTADFLGRIGPIDPPAIGVASVSGGACGIYADLAERHGLDVSPYSEETGEALRAVLPDFATILNPLDVTGATVSDPTLWARTMPILHRDPTKGLAVAATVLPNIPREIEAVGVNIVEIVAGAREAGKVPVVCGFSLEDPSEGQATFLKEVAPDLITLPDLDFGVRALAHLQRWSKAVVARPAPARSAAAPAVRPSGERETLAYLAERGAPVVPASLATSPAQVGAAFEALGGVVVLKIASPDIAHKTEAGGVRLGLSSRQAVERAFDEIIVSAKAYAPEARIEGVIVAPMRGEGVELIVGVSRDPDWGPSLVVGMGGVLTEVMKDSQVRLLPVTAAEAKEMLTSLAGAKLLSGYRGQPAANLDRIASAIVAIADAALALGPSLAALEVNPLWVRGETVECLDALTIYSD